MEGDAASLGNRVTVSAPAPCPCGHPEQVLVVNVGDTCPRWRCQGCGALQPASAWEVTLGNWSDYDPLQEE